MLRIRSRLLLAATAALISLAPLAIATPASAMIPDGHRCWFVSPYSPPSKINSDTVNYTGTVQCDGPVRRIDLTVELLYHGLIAGPGSGQTVNGATRVLQDPTQIPLFGFGVNNPGAICASGYYSGRTTATVQYLSGSPEFITGTVQSQPVSLSCPPPPIPVPPPGGAVTVTNPGTQSMYIWDTVALQMRATGGSGSYAWSASGLPPGLSINPSTGLITGTVRSTGTTTVTVTAVAGTGGQGQTSFTWSVRREPCPTC